MRAKRYCAQIPTCTLAASTSPSSLCVQYERIACSIPVISISPCCVHSIFLYLGIISYVCPKTSKSANLMHSLHTTSPLISQSNFTRIFPPHGSGSL